MAHEESPGFFEDGGPAANPRKRQSYDPELPTDAHSRPIDYLTKAEVDRLIGGAKQSRYPARNALLILML